MNYQKAYVALRESVLVVIADEPHEDYRVALSEALDRAMAAGTR